jgi:malate synthase
LVDQVTQFLDRAGLRVAATLATFIEVDVLPGTGLEPATFWQGVAGVFTRFAPENQALLRIRDEMQAHIDAWHHARMGKPWDASEYRLLLEELGYLRPEPDEFEIDTQDVDPEVAQVAGPQLVVPILNARFLLNAANARWGSLYDALYGTDALGSPPEPGSYDKLRGEQVVRRAKRFLDEAVPLASDSHANVSAYRVVEGVLTPALADPAQLVGYRGAPSEPEAILLRHHDLHLEIIIDRTHPVGRDDLAGVADVILEAAVTTIADLEDSVAAVDAEDKVAAYANWLGLMKGTLQASFEKGGRAVTRSLAPDRTYLAAEGSELTLPGRSLMFIRNVGHLMTTPALQLADGNDAPEGILDAIVTSLISVHDVRGRGAMRNSRAGSIYIVKPKMHGPDEAAFTNRLMAAVEDLLGLDRNAIKVGLMDEERRTSANLAACIGELRHRIVFVNTGFLDRTGDEIHTSMHAGAMLPKAAIKESGWIAAYEDRNVLIALACGFAGRAQIGKGMWAMPDLMADMLVQKVAHPLSGATTAWVPSPTAATLHALHYHQVDTSVQQAVRAAESTPRLDALLTPPLAKDLKLTEEEVRAELDNNVQGILGYVVRWIDEGVGCSKVPDIRNIGLMEDRATLRISSQLLANWLVHGLISPADVDASLLRMAHRVDEQNQHDVHYKALAISPDSNVAFQTARKLIVDGALQPNGYTEPLLHAMRLSAKRAAAGTAALSVA